MISNPWVVSPITPADLPGIFAIENQTSSPWTFTQLAGELSGATGVQLACRCSDSDRLTAYLMGRTVCEEAEILKIATNPEDRRRGAAGCLINAFINLLKAKGLEKCHLELRATNTPARRLYEKFDFLVTGLRKNYYSEPVDDALCMSRLFADRQI